MNTPSVFKLIVAVLFLATMPIPVHALTPGQVFDKVKDSIVVVKTLNAAGKVKTQGSGVLLPSGKVATNCHVVEGGASYQVSRGKQIVHATLYAEDGNKDICLLDAKGIGGEPVQLGKATTLKIGDPVYTVGAPKGLELSLSDGIVAQLWGEPPPLIQTTAAISHGSSGGGLFDGEGRLIGLTTLYIEGGQSLNFAMPVEWIDEIKPGRKPVAEGRGQTEWLKGALALEQMKDWQGMLDWCQKWTKSEPKNSWAWYNLGFAYASLKRYNDAIEAFRQALQINPDYTNAWYNPWYNLGVVYGKLKRYDDAIDAYNQGLRINPEYAGAWNNLGVIYGELKRYDDAIDAYRKAVRIDPKYAFAWYNFGFIYTSLKRYNDAIEAFRQALRINPELAEAWYNLGIAYGGLNRHNDAIEAFRQAIRINPEYAAAWGNLGYAYSLSGNRTAALEVVKELRRLDPAQADKLFNVVVPR
jgi:cytochrome c-type biogenesis protein CcmH/NrfG